jgi:hypothetical protein
MIKKITGPLFLIGMLTATSSFAYIIEYDGKNSTHLITDDAKKYDNTRFSYKCLYDRTSTGSIDFYEYDSDYDLLSYQFTDKYNHFWAPRKPQRCLEESMYYQDVKLAGGKDGDQDGDGIGNLDEVKHGYSPLSFDSFPLTCDINEHFYKQEFTHELWEIETGNYLDLPIVLTGPGTIRLNESTEKVDLHALNSNISVATVSVLAYCNEGVLEVPKACDFNDQGILHDLYEQKYNTNAPGNPMVVEGGAPTLSTRDSTALNIWVLNGNSPIGSFSVTAQCLNGSKVKVID